MKDKICNKCLGNKVKKDGKMRGKQRYKCCSCGYVFQNSSRNRISSVIWKDFGEGKQTYQQLSSKYKLSTRTVQKKLDKVSVKKKR